MSRSGLNGGITPGPRVPLQCPFCDAHDWVTLVTRATLEGPTFRWRCTSCNHEWSAIQPIPSHTEIGQALPIPCPKCQHVGSRLRVASLTVMMVTCARCGHTWATEYKSLPEDIQEKIPDALRDLKRF
jgi:DNA-directed RNA polymerase subunit M/transcription elongation factor TFIIS